MHPASTGSHETPQRSRPAEAPTGPPIRIGQVVRLRPEHTEAYLALHRTAWPEVLAMISECNITNYSIFHRDGLLFSYFEYVGSDWDGDNAKMMADPVTREWWKLTDPCQQPVAGHDGPRPWAPMTEVFHHH